MRILNISNFYEPIPLINSEYKPKENLPQKEKFDYSLAEMIGRSQVNFKGSDDFELNKKDKLFIESTVYNLRLSKDKKEILKNEVINFLKTKKLSSISDIDLDDGLYLEGDLMEILSDKLQLDDMQIGLLRAHLYERIDAKRVYVPTDRRFGSDKMVMLPIVKKYGLNDKVFRIMVNEATEKEYESLFDIFKTGNNPAGSELYKILSGRMGESDLCNMIIDLNALADIDDKTIRYQILYNADFNTQKATMAAEIKKHFGINDKISNIIEHIKKLDEPNVTPMQVAFEIADKYNLPEGAEQEILDWIYIYSNDESDEV